MERTWAATTFSTSLSAHSSLNIIFAFTLPAAPAGLHTRKLFRYLRTSERSLGPWDTGDYQ